MSNHELHLLIVFLLAVLPAICWVWYIIFVRMEGSPREKFFQLIDPRSFRRNRNTLKRNMTKRDRFIINCAGAFSLGCMLIVHFVDR